MPCETRASAISLPTVTKMPPIWKAVLLAPLGVPLSIALSAAWDSVSNSGFPGLRDLPATVLLVFLFGLPVAYGAMLLFGVPYVLWLRAKGWLNWVFVCTGAGFLGAVIWTGYWQLSFHPPPLARTVLVGALIGLVVGVIFCLVARLPGRAELPGGR